MWCIYNKVNAFFFRSKVGMAIFFAKAGVKNKVERARRYNLVSTHPLAMVFRRNLCSLFLFTALLRICRCL